MNKGNYDRYQGETAIIYQGRWHDDQREYGKYDMMIISGARVYVQIYPVLLRNAWVDIEVYL